MAPSMQKKIAAACEKMKEFGISKVKVKKAIEDLLKVYCDNWNFIEDDDYRVLMDAVLERKDEDKLFRTPEGKGWGVHTLEDLPKGAFVCEYVGEVLTNMELYERIVQNKGKEKHTYPLLLDADWCSESILKDEETLCLDATLYGNVSRFINHRCADACLIGIPVEVETPDHYYYHLALFTKRTIAAMEELTWDYGIDFNDQDHSVNVFECLCNSSLCRDQRQKK